MTEYRARGLKHHGTGVPDGKGRLDGAALLSRFDGKLRLVQELVTIFLADCPAMMAAIRDKVARGDALAIRYATHHLRGSVGNFGLSAAYERARQLEVMADTEDLRCAAEVYALLEQAIGQLQEELKQLLQDAPAE